MDDGSDGGRTPARRRAYVRYSEALADRLCARLEAGEMLYRICREPGMPTPEAVKKWTLQKPKFAERLKAARRAGGRPEGARGPGFTYCREVGDEIFMRLCEGESLTKIGADPTMPSLSTIFYWRRRIPEFEDAVRMGKRIQAEMFCDKGWELASEATPETAYLTHVRLNQLRWQAGVLAPKVFRLKPVEPEEPTRVVDLLFRRFKIETDPESGKQVVVAYCPNPETGEIEREGRTRWRPGPDHHPLPGGGILPPEPGWED